MFHPLQVRLVAPAIFHNQSPFVQDKTAKTRFQEHRHEHDRAGIHRALGSDDSVVGSEEVVSRGLISGWSDRQPRVWRMYAVVNSFGSSSGIVEALMIEAELTADGRPA